MRPLTDSEERRLNELASARHVLTKPERRQLSALLKRDGAVRRALARQADPGYAQAVAEELLQMPEAVTFLEQRDADIMFNALAQPYGPLTPRRRRRALAFVGLQQSGMEPL